MKVTESEGDEYVHSLSLGGLWTPNDNITHIAERTEVTFWRHLWQKKNMATSIPTDVIDDVLAMPTVKSL